MVSFRYSQWDGSQEFPELTADELMKHLSDDLLSHGDLQHALRQLLQRGMGNRMPGLQDLMQQLRQSRQQRLDRYNLGSILDQIKEKLDEIINTEREGIQRRLDEARGQMDSQPMDGDGYPQPGEDSGALGEMDQSPSGDEGGSEGSDGGESASGTQSPLASPQRSGMQRPQAGQRGQRGQQSQQSGGQQPGGQQTGGQQPRGQQPGQGNDLLDMLEKIAGKNLDFLDQLPNDPAGQLGELSKYEFMDQKARELYDELLKMLQQQMMDSFFQNMSQAMQSMTPDDMKQLGDMLKNLNEMLQQKMRGGQPDFQNFMEKFGQYFPDNPQNLDELLENLQKRMAQMQSLLDSMSPEQRRALQEMMDNLLQDEGMRNQLADLAQALEQMMPSAMRQMRNQYPFRGDESLSLNDAMHLMEQLQQLDQIERQLKRAEYGSGLDDIDAEQLRDLVGDRAADTLEQLRRLTKMLEEAGYIQRNGDRFELTPRGMRKIGQKALEDIFDRIRKDRFGNHSDERRGIGSERIDDTKGYEFGDTFHLNIERTLRNAIMRSPGTPIHMEPRDFEVYRTEQVNHAATVMMVDLSWSMTLRGAFLAAKKVALALNNLIKTQFPRDDLYLVGFSRYARELETEDLHRASVDEYVYGTNMHHALMLAQKLLSRHRSGTRQILMITDGEPTAHLEGSQAYFSYPPSIRTIQKTLREVKRCTDQGIIINTFMLEQEYYLVEFVNQITKINKGRAFYTTPDKLGQYILVDYLNSKRKRIA